MVFSRQSICLSSSQHSYNSISSQTSHPFLSMSPPPISNVADRPELIPGKIDVWYACVDCSPKEIRKFETLISTEEKTRSQRFRSAQDRERYIVQHGMLRSLLCGYVGCGPRQVDIRTSVNGKLTWSARIEMSSISVLPSPMRLLRLPSAGSAGSGLT
jgi:hypothetical protein